MRRQSAARRGARPGARTVLIGLPDGRALHSSRTSEGDRDGGHQEGEQDAGEPGAHSERSGWEVSKDTRERGREGRTCSRNAVWTC